jgi:hypothetical protein
MKKLFLIVLLSILSSSAFARVAWVDNKAICEKTEGNWRLFNNDCGDSCEKNFSLPVCSSAPTYNCDCGKNKCWDGDKCISNKAAKYFWDEIAQENKEDREEELEILKEDQEAFYKDIKNKKIFSITPTQSKLIEQEIAKTPSVEPLIEADPEIERINNEKKQLCEQKNGVWKEFKNGCVDNCASQISKLSMCTSAITFGCECGETKCWDSNQNSCIEVEDYRKLLSQPIPIQPSSPIVINQPNNPLSLNPVEASPQQNDILKDINDPTQLNLINLINN